MREILTGQVSEGLLGALFGLISREELCGVLRVTQGATINTVFFEIGVPIFAVGAEVTELSQESPGGPNVLAECTTLGGAATLTAQSPSDNSAAGAGANPEAALEAAKRIILSMFEWRSGEYLFDSDMFALRPIDLRLEWTADECIEQGMRLVGEPHTVWDGACAFQPVGDTAVPCKASESAYPAEVPVMEAPEYIWEDSAIAPVELDSIAETAANPSNAEDTVVSGYAVNSYAATVYEATGYDATAYDAVEQVALLASDEAAESASPSHAEAEACVVADEVEAGLFSNEAEQCPAAASAAVEAFVACQEADEHAVSLADETTPAGICAEVTCAEIASAEVTCADVACAEATAAEATCAEIASAEVAVAEATCAEATAAEATGAEASGVEVTSAEVTEDVVACPEVPCDIDWQAAAPVADLAQDSTRDKSAKEESSQAAPVVLGAARNWSEVEPPVFSDVWMVYTRPGSVETSPALIETIPQPNPPAVNTIAPEAEASELAGPEVSVPRRVVEINRRSKQPVPQPEPAADSQSQIDAETNSSPLSADASSRQSEAHRTPAAETNSAPLWTYESDAVERPSEPDDKPEIREAVERVIGELDVMLSALEGADFYRTLGVDRLASTRRINLAYAAKKRALTRYRSQSPDSQLLTDKLDTLLGKYNQAFETLGDLERRRRYDQPLQAKPLGETKGKGGAERIRLAPPAKLKKEEIVRNTDHEPRPDSKAGHAGGVAQSSDSGGLTRLETSGHDRLRPDQEATLRFQQGVQLYRKRDLHMALYFLREAVRLDPSKVDHHYYLGLALSVLSKARKRHIHDAGCHVTCTLDGYLYGNQRVRREAVKHLATAAELDPNNSRVFKDLAALYEDAGMPRKAEYYMDRAVVLGDVSAQYDQHSRDAR